MTGVPREQLELLELAVSFHDRPLRLQAWKQAGNPLPAPLTLLLRLLAPMREDDALLTACAAHCGTTREHLTEAARFFVEQVCLAEDRDHYRIMGLQPQAGDALIKEHYRLLMRAFHPDRAGVSEAWADRFAARVNRAYRVLRRPETRARYDRDRHDPPPVNDARGGAVPDPSSRLRRLSNTAFPKWPRMARKRLLMITGIALIGLAGASIQLFTAPSQLRFAEAPVPLGIAPPGIAPPVSAPVPDWLGTDELRSIVRRFQNTFEQGDIAGFMSLFTSAPRSSAGVDAGQIRRQHRLLFATTESRSMELGDLRFRPDSRGGGSVIGRYRIRLRDWQGRASMTSNGILQLGIVRHDDGSLRIAEFFYHGR